MKDGLVELTALSPALPGDVAALVEARRADIVAGRLHPFSGRIVDNQGRLRHSGGAMTDAAIAQMDWFVAGVVGTLPKSK